MCRVINAIQCQVWFSSLKLKGYHVVASCTFSCTFFVQSKSTQCHVSLHARANVPLSTNRYQSWRLVGETFQWNISFVRKHACSGAFDMIIRSACALLLCLFSRIMSLRVFSETSLGKRVNLVLSDFNHLLDWEAEVLRYGSFVWGFVLMLGWAFGGCQGRGVCQWGKMWQPLKSFPTFSWVLFTFYATYLRVWFYITLMPYAG